jgi:hypothetical protein
VTDMAEWFEVDFDENTDGVEEESGLLGVPAGFLRRLRDLVPSLSRLGFSAKDTSAWYEDGRLTVALQIRDDQARVALRALRLEIGDTGWVAAWVDPGRYDQPEFEQAYPEEQTGGDFADPQHGVDTAVEWFESQLRRPIFRFAWHDGGRVIARTWRLTDVDRPLVASGSPDVYGRPETADERVQVRP